MGKQITNRYVWYKIGYFKVPCSNIFAAGHKYAICISIPCDQFTKIDFSNVVQLATGRFSCIARTSSGEVFGKGTNTYGELSLGHTNIQTSWTKIGCSKFGNSSSITAIQCGFGYCMFLTSNHHVLTCGCNEYGQLVREFF